MGVVVVSDANDAARGEPVPGGGVGDAEEVRLPRFGIKGEMDILVMEAEWAW